MLLLQGKLDLLPVVAARNSLTIASTVFFKNGVFYSQRPLQRSLPNQLFVVNLKIPGIFPRAILQWTVIHICATD